MLDTDELSDIVSNCCSWRTD